MPGRASPEDASFDGHVAVAGPRVVLVNLPFAGYRQPSLALGLLKAELEQLGAEVTVIDATLTFAEMITPEVYDAVAGWPAQDLLGDRVFAALRARPPLPHDDEYEQLILGGGEPAHDIPHFGKPPLTPQLRAGLREARRRAADLFDVCLAEITELQPQVVGLTTTFSQVSASLALAERVKAAVPEAWTVLGGAGCRGEMGAEVLRRFPFVDQVVDGEGERALPQIVLRRARLGSVGATGGGGAADDAVAGTAAGRTPAGAPVDLDALTYPDFSDYFARLAASPLVGTFVPRLPMETSRGCWWGEKRRCTFCGQASEVLAYRQKSPERALDELQHLIRVHPGCPVFFTDEIAPRDAFDTFIPRLGARAPGLEVVYFEVRPDLRREHLAQLAAAGIRRLETGIESLSTSVLRLMRKGTTALQGVQFLKWAREEGLDVVWNLIWGIPGEDPHEYERMARMVPLLTHLQPPNTVGEFRLDRFSPIFDDPAHFGVTDVHAIPAYRHVYDLPGEALDRLAYFFSFECKRPAPVVEYTKDLAAAIVAWKAGAAGAGLWYTDDGESLTVDDERPGFASDEYTVLTGAHRAAYLSADTVKTAEALRAAVAQAERRAVSADELAETLAPLLDQGLMLQDGERYLSLAVCARSGLTTLHMPGQQ